MRCVMIVLEGNLKSVKKCATLAKYGVFEALYLMKEASFHLFDTFLAKIKDKTFI